jgi:hypothetical protein
MFLKQKKESTVLLLDIGNGSVGGALAVIEHTQKPNILFSVRKSVAPEDKPTIEKLQKTVLDELQNVLAMLVHTGLSDTYIKKHSKKIDTVLCTLSSPWYQSEGKSITISETKKFVVTERFLTHVLEKELQTFVVQQTKEKEEQHTLADQKNAQDMQVIEQKFTSMSLNGYKLSDPIGQSTQTFEASLFVSQTDKTFLSAVNNAISQYTHANSENILYHTFPFIAFSIIPTVLPGVSDYLFFDIGGEITDIIWVSGGKIQKTISFPSGKNLIIRRISKRLDVPDEVARSFLHLYMDTRADENLQKEIMGAISDVENEWNVYLEDALVSLSSELALPHDIFISTYPQTYQVFEGFLKTEKADMTNAWRKKLSITYLGSELLSKYIDMTSLQSFDAFMGLEALFLTQDR